MVLHFLSEGSKLSIICILSALKEVTGGGSTFLSLLSLVACLLFYTTEVLLELFCDLSQHTFFFSEFISAIHLVKSLLLYLIV
jgi:hypothetical protein